MLWDFYFSSEKNSSEQSPGYEKMFGSKRSYLVFSLYEHVKICFKQSQHYQYMFIPKTLSEYIYCILYHIIGMAQNHEI